MRRVELIIKPQNNTESFFVWKTHNFFHVLFSVQGRTENGQPFFCFLGDDSSSIFFPFNFFLFHKKTAILFSTIFATLWSQILEKIASQKIFFEPLNFCCEGFWDFHSLIPFVWKTRWFLIKNEEETETITFQISTTELTKRKAKNKKSHTFVLALFCSKTGTAKWGK